MTWKDKTCEKCIYREGMDCRRFPPVILHSLNVRMENSHVARYPLVTWQGLADTEKNGQFMDACAEYFEG